jgi:hypothetical protein
MYISGFHCIAHKTAATRQKCEQNARLPQQQKIQPHNQEYTSKEKACLAGGSSKMVSETDTSTDVESFQADDVISIPRHDCVDDGFRSSSGTVLSPIREIPTRSRLDTAETDQIRNFVRSPDIYVAATQLLTVSSRIEDDDQRDNDDILSTVSSLSKDDSLLPPPVIAESVVQGETCLPTEVSITVKGNDTPEWLTIEPIVMQPTLRGDQSLSSNVVRPVLCRDQSAPPVLVKVSPQSPPHPPPSTLISPCPSHRRNYTSPSLESSSWDSLSDPATCKLLEGRKKRTLVRVQSANGSVGSFVGQSSLITAPTVSSPFTESTICYKSTAEACRKLSHYTGADDGIACCTANAEDAYRKRNVVKEELKYILGLVASPIRLLKKADSARNANLQRSEGRLT